jgi:hypothetical protein
MASVTKGTAHIWGIAGTVTGLTVTSYTVTKTYANADEILNQQGEVIGVRYSDLRVNLTLEGLVPTSYTANPTDTLSFTGNGIAFTAGHIVSVEERGEAKGFMRISLSAVDYENITS